MLMLTHHYTLKSTTTKESTTIHIRCNLQKCSLCTLVFVWQLCWELVSGPKKIMAVLCIYFEFRERGQKDPASENLKRSCK